jgi:hypothetical protein
MRRALMLGLAAALAVVALWLIRAETRAPRGVEWRPQALRLRVGERAALRLWNNEPRVIAASFRLRFDERVVAIDDIELAYASILAGGNAIVVPVRRAPGLVEVAGIAMTGQRAMKPSAPLCHVTVRGLAPGTASLRVEALEVIDVEEQRRTLAVEAAEVTVAGP